MDRGALTGLCLRLLATGLVRVGGFGLLIGEAELDASDIPTDFILRLGLFLTIFGGPC